jgi:L-lactate dehydrogenase complex protein LldG
MGGNPGSYAAGSYAAGSYAAGSYACGNLAAGNLAAGDLAAGAAGAAPASAALQTAAQTGPPAPSTAPLPPEPREQFAQELTALGGKLIACKAADLPQAVLAFLSERGLAHLLVDEAGAELLQGGLALFQKQGVLLTRQPEPRLRAGLTGALAGLASTGSLAFAATPGSPLAASLLPEIHLAALKASQIGDDLPAVLRLLQGCPAAVLVTGPSRTADIEMTLTIGVHGPKELVVFLMEDG